MSRILFISPDYASHYFPMSAVGQALGRRGHTVLFATGRGLRPIVGSDGFEHEMLVLGPGSNPGLMRPKEQTAEERRQLNEFFEATRLGMIPTLLHQARNRHRDLLWRPMLVAENLERLYDSQKPDAVVVDQLAFGATAALRGLGIPFVSFHPGHPSAVSVGWPYGYPPRSPSRLRVELDELESLKELCRSVANRFTDEYNGVISELDPTAPRVGDAFAAVSELRTIINYPGDLALGYGLPARARFVGSSVRSQAGPDWGEMAAALSRSRPRIFVSLGSFFSARSDLLAKIAHALRHEPADVVLARGITPIEHLQPIPDHWIVEEYLPQPAWIRRSDLVITHGGNNTVTEALAAGVPLLVGPLSTDQFAGAADIERAGVGRVFDPNHDTAANIAAFAHDVLQSEAVARAADLGARLRSTPGQGLAADLIEDSTQNAGQLTNRSRNALSVAS